MFLSGLCFGDDLVGELLRGAELPHSTECLKPAFVNKKLVSRVGIGGCYFERLVEVSERVIVGTQLYVDVSNRSEITDLRPGVTEHHGAHQRTGDFLPRCRHISFEKQGKSELTRRAVFHLLVSHFMSERKGSFPVAAHGRGQQIAHRHRRQEDGAARRRDRSRVLRDADSGGPRLRARRPLAERVGA